MSVLRSILGALSRWALTILAAAALLQLLLILAPGDPVDLLPNGEELRPALEREWRLDRPAHERILRALADAATGDLGESLSVRPGEPVLSLVAKAGPPSLLRLLGALAVSMAAGVGLAAWRARAASGLARAISALPVFLLCWLCVTGLNAAAWAGMEAGWWARPEWFALPDQSSPLRSLLAVLALGLASGALSEVRGATRDELRRIEADGYLDGARGLGLAAWPHLALNLLPPLLTVAASRVGFLLGGLVVVEKALLLGGAGSLLWDAALGRDYPLALGLGLLSAVTVASARLVAELLRHLLDPRLREGGA